MEEDQGRYEHKFIIDKREYTLLKQLLPHILKADPHTGFNKFYNVRSFYFDDPFDSAYYEKINGVFERRKFRIRFYDFSDTFIKLEKKGKRGGITYKSDMSIDRDIARIALTHPEHLQIDQYDAPVYKEFVVACKTKRLLPKVIVGYDREAYLLNYEGIRICFDSQIKAGLPSENGFSTSLPVYPVLEDDKIIFEVKYRRFLPNYLREIIERIDSTHTAFSKYSLSRLVLEKNHKHSR